MSKHVALNFKNSLREKCADITFNLYCVEQKYEKD